MKKYFLIVLLYGCCTSCNLNSTDDDKKDTDSTTRQTTEIQSATSKDSMGSSDAKRKIKDIKKLDLKNFDVAWTEFGIEELKGILCNNKDITRVRFFLGAFDTIIKPGGKPMPLPMIMMQIQTSDNTAQPTYEYAYYSGKMVCPPPEPCYQIENEK